jgi:hypothetical protein
MSVATGGSGYFSIGDVLTRAWTLLTANLLFFIGVTAIVYAVVIGVVAVAVGIAIAAGVAGGNSSGAQVVIGIMIFVGAIFALAAVMASQAALLFGAFQYLRGIPVRIGESLRRGMGRIWPLIGLGLLSGLAMGFAFILLIVPCIILMCMWFVAVPACVVEGLGPIESMSRSAALTKGFRWHVLGIAALVFFGRLVITQLVQLGLAPVNSVLAAIAGVLVSTFLALYGYCAVIMTYHDLRVAKEGVDTTQIASVFD